MKNYLGYGFSLWNGNIEQIKDFIITACVYKKLFLHGKLTSQSLNQINGTITRMKVAKSKEDIEKACRKKISVFLANIINYIESIDMLEGISFNGKEYLVFAPKHPWQMNEKEKFYTKEDAEYILEKYRKTLCTEKPHEIYQVLDDSVISHAEQCLIDNGIESDEAAIVLQALGYIMMDAELYPQNLKKSMG